MEKTFERLFNTETGGKLLSFLFGIALSVIFSKSKQIYYTDLEEIEKNTYKYNEKCIKFTPKLSTCE